MSARLLALCVAAVLAGAAIGHASGGPAPAGGPALVIVEARGAQAATGFVVGPSRVVTVAHVLDGPVTVRGDEGVPRAAVVLRRDERLDLALLGVRGVQPGGGLSAKGDARRRPARRRSARRARA